MPDSHANFAYSTVATAPSPATSGTSLTVATGDGVRFPTPPFNAVLWPAGALALTANAEIVQVTLIVGDVLTVVRTQEGTTARTVLVGDQVAAAITAKTLTDVEIPPFYVLDFLDIPEPSAFDIPTTTFLEIQEVDGPEALLCYSVRVHPASNQALAETSSLYVLDYYDITESACLEIPASALMEIAETSGSPDFDIS